MNNADVARIFARIATMLELDEANVFRVRAYREAARVIDALTEPVENVAAREKGLESVRGLGKDLAQKVRDVLATGTTAIHDELCARYPEDVLRMTELQGLGPRRVRLLFDRLSIRDCNALEAAAREGRLRELPGFGEKLEQKILQSLSIAGQVSGRLLLGGAWAVAHELAARLRAVPGVTAVELAGSFRRRRETVGDLDLLVTGGSPATVMQAFVSHSQVAEVLGRGDTKSSVRLVTGLQVDLRLVPESSLGAALLYFTGSKEHNIELRRLAIDKGWSLNEYGLTEGERVVASRTEEDIYRALGLAWVPPELRESRGEIALAREDRLPKLLEESDLRGDLHIHTTRSDGKHTLLEMVKAAKARGYAYCAITEHSKALAMAGGFNEARVRQSVEEIAQVRRQVPGIEVLHGLEVDILADGALDLADDALELLDWVIVSLHSRLDQPADAVTARVLRALEHPAVCAMAHPCGRIIGTRTGAALDFERVFARAAELGVALEINSQPDRLDLSDTHARLARERGCTLVIDTDAHQIGHLESIRFGVFVARRAGLEQGHVLNALPYERLRRALRKGGKPRAAERPATVAVPAAAAGADRGTSPAKGGAAAERERPTGTAPGTGAAPRPQAKPRAPGAKARPPAPGAKAQPPAPGTKARPPAPGAKARPRGTKKQPPSRP